MYTKQRLSNGLRVIFAPLKDTGAVTVLAMTNVGSRYETAQNNGVSHFLEHMMFKGTDKRLTALDVSRELDGVGASFNAFTGKDYTGYYVKLASEHVDLALDIISDMLWHSRFQQEEIEKERHVIMEEINMYADNPIMHIEELFEERMFGKTHPLGRLISGPKSVIAKLNRKEIVDYFTKHYFPSNMVLCIAGKFPEKKTKKRVEEYFGHFNHKRSPSNFIKFHTTQRRPQLQLLNRDTEQVQLGLGFPALPYGHKDLSALSLLSVILGGNMSSRLFTRVREQEGLAYSVSASRTSYHDSGTFFVHAGLDKKRVQPALKLILEELYAARDHGVTPHELEHAKEFIKGKLVLDLEDSESLANYITSQELLLHQIETPDMRMKKIAAVQQRDIQRVAHAVFQKKLLNCALIGPFRDGAPFERILRSVQ